MRKPVGTAAIVGVGSVMLELNLAESREDAEKELINTHRSYAVAPLRAVFARI